MRAKILYLTNFWMDFKMLLTTNRLLDLVVFLLLSSISLNSTIYSTILINLSTFMHNLSTMPIIIQMRAAAKQAQPIYATATILFFSLLLREQNGGAEKVINP